MPLPILRTRFALVVLVAIVLVPGSAPGQTPWSERFEGPEPSWRQAGGNVRYQIGRHERVQGEAHGGAGCERLAVSGQGGTEVYLSHPVGRPQVIAELTPSVWLKSDRPGLQLLARVILPRTEDPRSGQPVSTLVVGTSYTQVGRWQQLEVRDIPNLLARQVRVLRLQLGPGVDATEAYVDQMLLNVYGGPGTTNVWIDDLEIAGYAESPPGAPRPVAVSPRLGNLPKVDPSGAGLDGTTGSRRRVELRVSVLEVDGHPMLPRAIQYQGESLARLKELGFNTIWLARTPSSAILREAGDLGLMVVCPPPEFPPADAASEPATPTPRIGPEYDPVLAWDLGWGLSEQDLPATRKRAQQIRDADRERGRPRICHPEVDLRAFSGCVDLLMVGQSPVATSLEMVDYGTWIRERPRLARPGTIIWSTIQTQPALALHQQWLSGGREQSPPPTVTSEQIRLVAYTAITAGSRGLLFESRSSLDDTDPETRARAAAMELLNQELEMIRPWVAAGNLVDTVQSNQPEVSGAVFRYNRTRLLVPLWTGLGAQFVPGQSAAQTLTFVVRGVPDSNLAYELVPGGLPPVRDRERGTGGVQVTLGEFSLSTLVLFTEDALARASLGQRAKANAPRAAQLQRQLAARKLQIAEEVDRRMAGRGETAWQPADYLVTARKILQQCDSALAAKDYANACLYAERAMCPLRLLERTNWQKAVASMCSPVASPATVCFSTLPWHWSMVEETRSWQVGANLLPASDFEQLPAILAAGWRHFQHATPGVETTADVVPEAAHSGSSGLRLVARSVEPNRPPTLVETPPLWITSPPVPVEAGALVQVSGWVHVPAPITGSVDGLMIFDSFSGRALAERIGDTTGWESFTLYRVAPQSGPMTVTFALAGLGEVWIDDVTVQTLGPAARP
ncbi:MAG: hypothetical protein NTW96_23295 [Planctomycetia bacterium]|nr:hypothetical protein [Planctomycetia bacterium]